VQTATVATGLNRVGCASSNPTACTAGVQRELLADRSERMSTAQRHNAHAVGTQALPRGKMDLSAGTTHRDLGRFHAEATPSPPAGDVSALTTRKNSALSPGTQALPRGKMDLSAGTTQSDLGKFDTASHGRTSSLLGSRKNSALSPGTQALPRGKMDLSAGTTQSDLGKFHAEATSSPPSAASFVRKNSALSPGTQALPRARMDLSGSTTQRDIGGFYSGYN